MLATSVLNTHGVECSLSDLSTVSGRAVFQYICNRELFAHFNPTGKCQVIQRLTPFIATGVTMEDCSRIVLEQCVVSGIGSIDSFSDSSAAMRALDSRLSLLQLVTEEFQELYRERWQASSGISADVIEHSLSGLQPKPKAILSAAIDAIEKCIEQVEVAEHVYWSSLADPGAIETPFDALVMAVAKDGQSSERGNTLWRGLVAARVCEELLDLVLWADMELSQVGGHEPCQRLGQYFPGYVGYTTIQQFKEGFRTTWRIVRDHGLFISPTSLCQVEACTEALRRFAEHSYNAKISEDNHEFNKQLWEWTSRCISLSEDLKISSEHCRAVLAQLTIR